MLYVFIIVDWSWRCFSNDRKGNSTTRLSAEADEHDDEGGAWGLSAIPVNLRSFASS